MTLVGHPTGVAYRHALSDALIPFAGVHREPSMSSAGMATSLALRSVRVENLSQGQQEQVLKIPGLKAGDIYDAFAVAALSKKLSESDSPLKGYGFSYSPKEDRVAQLVDHTLSLLQAIDQSIS